LKVVFSSTKLFLFLDRYGADIIHSEEYNINHDGSFQKHLLFFLSGPSGGSNAVFDLINRLPYPFKLEETEPK
jgi:hypothetical protein